MVTTLSETALRDLVLRQLKAMWPVEEGDLEAVESALPATLASLEWCFSHIRNKYYSDTTGLTRFDHLHGCQWAQFLYRLSRELWLTRGDASDEATRTSLCDRLYALNRMQCSADLFYQVELPDIFTFDHPLGSVMGRASYSDFFTFSQGCTVGNNHGVYPQFGESVFMMSDSKVIGNCVIGDNVIISSGSYVKDEVIEGGSLVFGASPNLTVLSGREDYVREYAEGVFRYE